MGLQLNMQKAEEGAKKLRLSMSKRGVNTPPSVDVGFDFDVSGSFTREHTDGTTTRLLHRLIPWAMVFDPDKKLDMFTFSNGASHAHYVGEITPATADDYVERNIIRRVPGWDGGTDYSYVLEKNLKHFGWGEEEKPQPQQKAGGITSWFGFGKKPDLAPVPTTPQKRPSIIIFVTDGENNDQSRTDKLLRDMQIRGDKVYVSFIGVRQSNSDFSFLKGVADRYSNTGFIEIAKVRDWVNKSDEEINDLLITDEFIAWLKAAA